MQCTNVFLELLIQVSPKMKQCTSIAEGTQNNCDNWGFPIWIFSMNSVNFSKLKCLKIGKYFLLCDIINLISLKSSVNWMNVIKPFCNVESIVDFSFDEFNELTETSKFNVLIRSYLDYNAVGIILCIYFYIWK